MRYIFVVFMLIKLLPGYSNDYRVIIFNFTVDTSYLSVSEGEIVADHLSAILNKQIKDTTFKILDRKHVFELISDRGMADKLPGIYNKETAVELGKLVEANYAIFGRVSFSKLTDAYNISATLVDIETGIAIANSSRSFENTNANAFDYIMNEIAYDLISKVKINGVPIKYIKSIGIQSIIAAYKGRFAGYDNVSIYFSGDQPLDPYQNQIKTLNGINPEQEIIAAIITNCSLEYAIYNDDTEHTSGSFLIVVNEDGIYWKAVKVFGCIYCDDDSIVERGGNILFKDLLQNEVEIKNIVLQEEISTVSSFTQKKNIKQQEIKTNALIFSDEPILTENDIFFCSFTLNDFYNLISQLKTVLN